MSDYAKNSAVVIGAGPAGLAAALGLAARGISVSIAETSPAASAAAARGRSAALFNRTVAFLEALGVWEECSAAAAPLKTLQFIDDTGRRLRAPDCAFSAAEIGEAAFGYNIANADLAAVLRRQMERLGLPLIATGPLARIEQAPHTARLAFENGAVMEAALVVAADGRASATRKAAGIRALTWAYPQIAIAASFSHERPHNGVCIELHRAAGPLTLIPLPGNASSFVWSERKPEAERLLGLGSDAFSRELERASHFALGRVLEISERGGFPLSALVAREYGKNRVALIGEAAHVAPPIGAQGLNLGFRDVEALLDLVSEAKALGDDIGSASLLREYSAARRGDIFSRTFATDALNRSLLTDFLPLQAGRGLGLYALSAIGPLRRAFMRRGIAPASFA